MKPKSKFDISYRSLSGAELAKTPILGTEHQVESVSAHDGAPINIHVWEKRRADLDPYQLSAAGRVVVLAHGSRRSARVAFDLPVPTELDEVPFSLMDVLALAGFDVFCVDIQNYGRSDHHPSGLKVTTEVAANDIRHVIDYLGVERAAKDVLLLGWSWGATVASIYAESSDSQVRKLVQYGPKMERVIPGSGGPIDVDLREQFFTSTQVSSDQSFQPQYGEEKVLKPWWDEGRKWDAQSPNGVAADFQNRLPLSNPAKISIPTLIVLGAGDFMWEEKDSLLRYFGEIASTDKHLALLPNGGHALHLHHGREQFFRRLIDFFGS